MEELLYCVVYELLSEVNVNSGNRGGCESEPKQLNAPENRTYVCVELGWLY